MCTKFKAPTKKTNFMPIIEYSTEFYRSVWGRKKKGGTKITSSEKKQQ